MQYKKHKKYSSAKTKKIIVALLAFVLLCSTLFTLEQTGAINILSSRNPADGKNIRYDPPTKEEKAAGDEQKKVAEQSQKNDSQRTNTTTAESANIIITDVAEYNNAVEVRAFVSNVYEDGTCTYLFSHGTDKVMKTSPAYKDSTTTICTNPMIKKSEFKSNGSWYLTVGFKSKNSTGQSEQKLIRIN